MATNFKFPDELEDDIDIETDEEEIEIIDDTPEEDRNIRPLPKEMVDELETDDESEEYSKKVKNKFQQYKKVYHDERRNKEAAQREQEAAIEFLQCLRWANHSSIRPNRRRGRRTAAVLSRTE